MKRTMLLCVTLGFALTTALSAQVVGTDPAVTGYAQIIEQPIGDTVKTGSLVAINGTNFGAVPGHVEIGCIDVTPESWSLTRITVRIPPMTATSQAVMLTVFCPSPPLYYRALAFKISE